MAVDKKKKKKKTVVDDEGGATTVGTATTAGSEGGEAAPKKKKSRTKSVALNNEKPLVRKKKSTSKEEGGKSTMVGPSGGGEATCMMPAPDSDGLKQKASCKRKTTIIDPEKEIRNLAGCDPEKMTAQQMKNLMGFVKQFQTVGVKGLLEEFDQFKTYNYTPFNTRHHELNPTKNRYKDIFCIDVSRVQLQDGVNGDYIHANVVDGKPLVNKFIATQGPIEATVNDFWRMVVQENIGYIFMLCSFVELDKKKCEEYYPLVEGETKKYLDISVTLVHTMDDAHFVNSKFILDAPGKPKRYIYHNYWKNWPDHGVPLTALAGLRLLRHARATKYATIVHCSAGVGRTGTLIAIEWLLQTICSKPPPYDMREMLKAIRNRRANAIQTAPQYVYIAYAIFRLVAMKDAAMIPAYMQFSQDMAAHCGVKIDGGGPTATAPTVTQTKTRSEPQ